MPEDTPTCDGNGQCNPNYLSDTFVCDEASDVCENEATCTGNAASCPPKTFKSGNICDEASDLCENDAVCSGEAASCPPKTFKNNQAVCRPAAGVCDAQGNVPRKRGDLPGGRVQGRRNALWIPERLHGHVHRDRGRLPRPCRHLCNCWQEVLYDRRGCYLHPRNVLLRHRGNSDTCLGRRK